MLHLVKEFFPSTQTADLNVPLVFFFHWQFRCTSFKAVYVWLLMQEKVVFLSSHFRGLSYLHCEKRRAFHCVCVRYIYACHSQFPWMPWVKILWDRREAEGYPPKSFPWNPPLKDRWSVPECVFAWGYMAILTHTHTSVKSLCGNTEKRQILRIAFLLPHHANSFPPSG